jgi:hypothetical protein
MSILEDLTGLRCGSLKTLELKILLVFLFEFLKYLDGLIRNGLTCRLTLMDFSLLLIKKNRLGCMNLDLPESLLGLNGSLESIGLEDGTLEVLGFLSDFLGDEIGEVVVGL